MAVDFDGLVLGPAMRSFALPITVTPNDEGVAYGGSQDELGNATGPQGVWRYQNVDVLLEDGSSLSSTTITLGIRISNFPSMPKVGYGVEASPPKWAPALGRYYLIDKVRPDGQGGADLILKAKQPVPSTG